MRRVFLWALVLSLLTIASVSAQDVNMAGDWTLYRVSVLGDFNLDEFRNVGGAAGNLMGGTNMSLAGDGTVTTDSTSLAFQEWSITPEGFLMFASSGRNALFKIRALTDNVYFLVSITVTEKNKQVTQIQVNPSSNLVVVRQ